jgi:hypothetical protein
MGAPDLLFDVSRGSATHVGAMTTAFVVDGAARTRSFGVRFLPGEAFGFVSIPAREARDASLPLEDVWGPFGHRLANQVSASHDSAARVAMLDRELHARPMRACGTPSVAS